MTKFNRATVEIWIRISNFIPRFWHVITYPCCSKASHCYLKGSRLKNFYDEMETILCSIPYAKRGLTSKQVTIVSRASCHRSILQAAAFSFTLRYWPLAPWFISNDMDIKLCKQMLVPPLLWLYKLPVCWYPQWLRKNWRRVLTIIQINNRKLYNLLRSNVISGSIRIQTWLANS